MPKPKQCHNGSLTALEQCVETKATGFGSAACKNYGVIDAAYKSNTSTRRPLQHVSSIIIMALSPSS